MKDVLEGGFSQDTKLRPTAEGLRDSFKTQQGLLNLLSHHDALCVYSLFPLLQNFVIAPKRKVFVMQT